MLKNFKLKVKNQLTTRLKTVRSNCSGEYCGKYDGLGEQHLSPFAKFLKECSVIS